jgi:hypothetical protein
MREMSEREREDSHKNPYPPTFKKEMKVMK